MSDVRYVRCEIYLIKYNHVCTVFYKAILDMGHNFSKYVSNLGQNYKRIKTSALFIMNDCFFA